MTFNMLIPILSFIWNMSQDAARCLFLFLSLLNPAISQCPVCCCVMPPLMACDVSPSPNGVFCHPVQHWVTCSQWPSLHPAAFLLALTKLPSVGQAGWQQPSPASLQFCSTVTLIRPALDRAGVTTDALLSSQPDMAQGKCWLHR